MEIEKKYTVKNLPEELDSYPYHLIEQGYLNVRPAIRVRKQDDIYYMTYKGAAGVMAKEEYNLELDEESYRHMLSKADGNIITKKRYLIPLNEDAFTKEAIAADRALSEALDKKEMVIELDVFMGRFEGTVVAEVEFPSLEAAAAYKAADWFDEDVTEDPRYRNSYMSRLP
ncbi:CYTH domain-containing protein [Butyrivibrio sp. MC2013]|uniref:CYTH domain-containing protein n=1 Tax=Butyrivibrio sp. MC2013 TaxID=1280686 RepID=UPI00047B4E00